MHKITEDKKERIRRAVQQHEWYVRQHELDTKWDLQMRLGLSEATIEEWWNYFV